MAMPFNAFAKEGLPETHHVLEICNLVSGEIAKLQLHARFNEWSLAEVLCHPTAIASESAGSLRHSRNTSAGSHREPLVCLLFVNPCT